jgi:hypothetical protein
MVLSLINTATKAAKLMIVLRMNIKINEIVIDYEVSICFWKV